MLTAVLPWCARSLTALDGHGVTDAYLESRFLLWKLQIRSDAIGNWRGDTRLRGQGPRGRRRKVLVIKPSYAQMTSHLFAADGIRLHPSRSSLAISVRRIAPCRSNCVNTGTSALHTTR